MSERKSLMAHHLVRGIILSAIAVYILFLKQSGSLTYYLAPHMIIYIKLTAIALYVIAVFQFYQAYKMWNRQASGCACSHPPSGSTLLHVLIYSLFVLPLALGFLMPETVMGSAYAAKKGVNLGASSAIGTNPTKKQVVSSTLPNPEQEITELFNSDEYTESYAKLGMKLYRQPAIIVPEQNYIETLTALDLYRDNFIGKQITIRGFIYRGEGMKSNQFAVARFQMQCCTADALPFGIVTEAPDAKKYGDDSWVEVTGTFGTTTLNGNTIMKLDAIKIAKTEPAEDAYVYPNYDFDLGL